VATRERRVDRGAARGLRLLQLIGAEIRLARRRLGLSLRSVAEQVGISASELSRIERGQAERVQLLTLARTCAVVGLDLSARAYPGSGSLRDSRQGRLLARLKGRVHASLGWANEAPLPSQGDQRAWDALIRGTGWRYGVEAELNPIDGQALLRRLALKLRDGDVDGVILLLPNSRQARAFRCEFEPLLVTEFPVPARLALARLGAGRPPGGNSIMVL
jgi:transcriptional regulator with XRE-family HTH domain